MNKHQIWKWFGYSSVLVLIACDISPATFNVNLLWRPWLLVISVVWFFCIVSGVFNP